MNDLSLWKFIEEKLRNNNPVILTIVLESKGSSPGKAGFKMAIVEGSKFVGTIGGGQMELDLQEECKKLFAEKKKIKAHRKLYHSEKVKKLQSGLVCQGVQTNFTLSLDKSDLKYVEKIIQSYEKKEPALLVVSPGGIGIRKKSRNENHINYQFTSEKKWIYEENIGVRDTIYIIGGGHVGLALSKQMKLIGFEVVIFDERADVQTIKENEAADEIIITGYDKIGNYVKEGNYSYVAIVTATLPTDKAALKQLLNKELKYIGLMGSSAKLKRIFSELKEEGIKQSLLNKVNAPIGILINSQTVEEIAVSIAAQIIHVKNN